MQLSHHSLWYKIYCMTKLCDVGAVLTIVRVVCVCKGDFRQLYTVNIPICQLRPFVQLEQGVEML